MVIPSLELRRVLTCSSTHQELRELLGLSLRHGGILPLKLQESLLILLLHSVAPLGLERLRHEGFDLLKLMRTPSTKLSFILALIWAHGCQCRRLHLVLHGNILLVVASLAILSHVLLIIAGGVCFRVIACIHSHVLRVVAALAFLRHVLFVVGSTPCATCVLACILRDVLLVVGGGSRLVLRRSGRRVRLRRLGSDTDGRDDRASGCKVGDHRG
mmetsp:Transcript_90717/g.194576  ORF Transcript_90717/g.194576 Transcript_90717/m.194576 type:complete len:215 (+) Transcript_90717:197-841(+)